MLPAYLIERPFLPTSISLHRHSGLAKMQVESVRQQSSLDLALLLPLWVCSTEGDTAHWTSLLRFLNSTASCLTCSCINSSIANQHSSVEIGISELYVILPAKDNPVYGLICKMAMREQLFPSPKLEIDVPATGDLKFDL